MKKYKYSILIIFLLFVSCSSIKIVSNNYYRVIYAKDYLTFCLIVVKQSGNHYLIIQKNANEDIEYLDNTYKKIRKGRLYKMDLEQVYPQIIDSTSSDIAKMLSSMASRDLSLTFATPLGNEVSPSGQRCVSVEISKYGCKYFRVTNMKGLYISKCDIE